MRELPIRKPNRLNDYDYSQNGAYFVTICTKDRHEILGKIVGDGLARPAYIELSEYGTIVEKEITKIDNHYVNVKCCNYIIMPNHIHAVIVIGGIGDESGRASPQCH